MFSTYSFLPPSLHVAGILMRDDTIVAGLSVPSSARPSSAFVSLQKLTRPQSSTSGTGVGSSIKHKLQGWKEIVRSCRASVPASLRPQTIINSHILVLTSRTTYLLPQPDLTWTRLTFCHSSTLCRPVSPVRNHAPPPLLKQPDAPQGLPPRPSILDPRAPLLPFCALLAPLTHRASLLTLDYPLHHRGPAFTASWSTQGLTPGFDPTASRNSIEGPPSFRSNSRSSLLRLPPSARPLLSRLSHHQLRYPSCPCPNKSLCLPE
ncbi:uncharacterized protein BDZ83DRAFT_195531 [Colletotrichum acutatum]|uniref:Uncharacterized protein n=1 Tax=Glomerella acutata TaxID=27357 RepID=A0AAD8UV15_GLOAC|nr:uncharacterized protein BDZ83DRAFT_195531 [Colletotrichum acutatum]KAK1727569.1 hypothetical protein BDZ83DRAFT_195531 [Colletotrichum acutatum]